MDKELFEDICKRAERHKDNKDELQQLFKSLKTVKKRLSEIEFNFALEMIAEYFEKCEDREEVKAFMKKNND